MRHYHFQLHPPKLSEKCMYASGPILEGSRPVFQWFSSNASANDITISPGNWNASLRYGSPRLPPDMHNDASIIHDTDSDGGGHTFHFNTNSGTARKDSGQMSTCTDLVDAGSISGATWYSDRGVNDTGAYQFNGNTYISIDNSGNKKDCNYVDAQDMSIAGWFNATSGGGDSQTIFSKYDTGNGGFEVAIENGNAAFTFWEDGNDITKCITSGTDYRDNNWNHFAVAHSAGDCELYVNGVSKDTDSSDAGHEHEDTNPLYIGMRSGSTNGFVGYIDDLMFWNNYILTSADVTALKEYSFGSNVHKINFFLENATGGGTTVNNLFTELDYDLPWSDQLGGSSVQESYAGSNFTKYMSEVYLKIASDNRLNFTMSYASGDAFTLLVDDSDLDGSPPPLSSHLQVPDSDEILPTYLYHDQDNEVIIFIYNAGDEGAWLTYPGTRVVFNGTEGHYAGLVHKVDNHIDTEVTMSPDDDSPFVPAGTQADVDFWHPQRSPTTSQPSSNEKIAVGYYDVTIFLNGYDEVGGIIVRSINLGTVEVVE